MANESFLRELADLTVEYQPSDEVRRAMAEREVVTVLGPSGVGKNSVMEATGLPIGQGVTTRHPRHPDEATYRFIQTDEEREKLLADVAAGDYVEVAIHPTTGEFYGSSLEDYNASIVTLLDVMPHYHYTFVRDGLFKSVHGCYITAPNFKAWQARLQERADMNDEEYRQRMREARASLQIGLADEDFYFILNDNVTVAGDRLFNFAVKGLINLGEYLPARRAGQLMLAGLLAASETS